MARWNAGTAGVVELPGGRLVLGRSLRDSRPAGVGPPELGVYLAARPHVEVWESVWIRWPDFGLPSDRLQAVEVLRHAYAEAATRRLEIACAGGSGRTGTAIALLARLAGVPAADAVAWTRAHYRPRAVEMPWQRRYAARADLQLSTPARKGDAS